LRRGVEVARSVSLVLLDVTRGAGSGIARLFLSIVRAFAEFERDGSISRSG
jgi:hypothetical protein